jgi:tetratricopeptide (TPR) repeat protein
MEACEIFALSKKLKIPRITLWYLSRKTLHNPSDTDAWEQQASLLMNGYGESGQARAVYEQAIAANPSSAFLWRRKADLLACHFSREEAEAAYSRALALDPENAGIYLSMARMYGFAGGSDSPGMLTPDRQKALELCDKALAFEPGNTEVLRFRSTVLLLSGRREESRAVTRRILEVDPGNRDALLSLALDLVRDGRDEEAVRVYEQFLGLYPDDTMSIWSVKGDALFRLGRYDEALAAHERAISSDPEGRIWNISPYLEGKADALAKLGRFDEAIAAYDRIRKTDPSWHYAKVTTKKAEVLVQQGRPDEAMRTLETALKDLEQYRPSMSPETCEQIRAEIGLAKESVVQRNAAEQGT